MTSCLAAAFEWWAAGASIVKASTDGSKAPVGQWKQYQSIRANPQTLQEWFGGGHQGIGIVCGQVSGGIEMLELEGRAVGEGVLEELEGIAGASGLGEVLNRLYGYCEETPSGGLHFVYRVEGGPVLGNTKLARRPATTEELAANPSDKVKVLIETRGEHGFVVIAPSGGTVHPSGKPWMVASGSASTVPVLAAWERDALFDLCRMLNTLPGPPPQPEPSDMFLPPAPSGTAVQDGPLRPGDDYEARTGWAEILTGWEVVYTSSDGTVYWRRPGKSMGLSATTGRKEDRDRLYVFTTSTPFQSEHPYTKFGAYALLHHGGDHAAAAGGLATLGYGEKRQPRSPAGPREGDQRPPPESETAEDLRRIVSVRGDTVTVRRTRWLWRDRIPLGGLALVAGKGDVSKSTLFAQFVAWITTGQMKGEFYGIPQNVGYVVNEDCIEETVAPRMIAHGADMSRVHFLAVQSPLGKDALSLPADADRLRAHINKHNLVATFVDPLSANVSGRSNDTKETRATYQEVNRIAEDTGSTIAGLAHTRKAGAGDVMEAIMGSSEQGNVARSVHGLVMDPEEDGARILSCEKLNVGQKHNLASLRFAVVSERVMCTDGSGDFTSMPRIEWLPETTDTASDILTDMMNGNAGVDECGIWLNDYLLSNGGEAYSSDVRAIGKRYSESMLLRARKKLGVRAKRTGEHPSRTLWVHPANTQGEF